LQLCLGTIWLLDAVLQYQPFMFRPSFVTAVIEPGVTGNPRFVTRSVQWASHLMLHHIVLFNAVFATTQLLIAVGLFWQRTVRPALGLSTVWALLVWWFGESFGGILVGASPLTGLPGAALLYAVVAILVWPIRSRPVGQLTSVATAGPAGATAAKLAWVALWGTFAEYLLLPDNRAPEAISQLLSHTDGQPGWLAAVMNGMSRAADHRGADISVVLALLCVGIALAMLARPLIWPALVLAATLGIVFCLAQGLGGIFTGQATDPSTGPLLILLTACYLPHRASPDAIRRGPRGGSIGRRHADLGNGPAKLGTRPAKLGSAANYPAAHPLPTVVPTSRQVADMRRRISKGNRDGGERAVGGIAAAASERCWTCWRGDRGSVGGCAAGIRARRAGGGDGFAGSAPPAGCTGRQHAFRPYLPWPAAVRRSDRYRALGAARGGDAGRHHGRRRRLGGGT
jgi:hypothetical protein